MDTIGVTHSGSLNPLLSPLVDDVIVASGEVPNDRVHRDNATTKTLAYASGQWPRHGVIREGDDDYDRRGPAQAAQHDGEPLSESIGFEVAIEEVISAGAQQGDIRVWDAVIAQLIRDHVLNASTCARQIEVPGLSKAMSEASWPCGNVVAHA